MNKIFIYFKAQHDDDDGGGDDMAVNMDGGKMDEFFQVRNPSWPLTNFFFYVSWYEWSLQ